MVPFWVHCGFSLQQFETAPRITEYPVSRILAACSSSNATGLAYTFYTIIEQTCKVCIVKSITRNIKHYDAVQKLCKLFSV